MRFIGKLRVVSLPLASPDIISYYLHSYWDQSPCYVRSRFKFLPKVARVNATNLYQLKLMCLIIGIRIEETLQQC